MSMSVGPSNVVHLEPGARSYRPSSAFTFHPYEHQPPDSPLPDDAVTPPAMSTRRASRLPAPFPTFLYASEPPPVTARNKQRVRPSAAQLSELKALYAVTHHPPRDVREALGHKIGMRYQSVTNWFQNQRSTAKKRDPDAAHTPITSTPRRSLSRSRIPSPGLSQSPPHTTNDNMNEPHASGDDDVPQGGTEELHEDCYDDHQSSAMHPRHRTDPVRDIIIAQAAVARQQQLTELPLPLSGAAIVPSFSDLEKGDSPSAATAVKRPPLHAPETPSAPDKFSRATTPLLSSFQVSRATSPSAASTTASNFEPGVDEPHGAEIDFGEGGMADQVPRGKRSRPSARQLVALRALHAATSSPTIEERTRVGREIGMELGKVTNWFRNLRQTARKKERRALEAEGTFTRRRGRNCEVGRIRPNKRSRLATFDDDEDDPMSASASISHTRSGVFETSSAVCSVDMDYDYERPDTYFVRHQGEVFAGSRETSDDRPRFGAYDDNPIRPAFAQSPEYMFVRRHDDAQFEGNPEHDHESRSELGTESDAAHEAVTPEPQNIPPCTDEISRTSHVTTPTSSRGFPSPTEHPTKSTHSKHPSVDDAMLLLAFHGAQT